MADRTDPEQRAVAPPVAPTDERAANSLPGRIAASGSWAGDRDRGRGWEELLSEFLAAILTWAGAGWLLDRWLDTDPWFLIAGAILGNSLGIYLMWLRSDPERATRAAGDRGARDEAGRRGVEERP